MDEPNEEELMRHASKLSAEQREKMLEDLKKFEPFRAWAEERLQKPDCVFLNTLLIAFFRVYYMVRGDMLQIMAEKMPPDTVPMFIASWMEHIQECALRPFTPSELRSVLNSMLRQYMNGKVGVERVGKAQASRVERRAQARMEAKRLHKEKLDADRRRRGKGPDEQPESGSGSPDRGGDPAGDGQEGGGGEPADQSGEGAGQGNGA